VSRFTCLVCGRPADGRLRVALWEEEEKGRLAAKSVPVCDEHHGEFLAGRLSRVEVARRFHAARGYVPAEWIGRIDRDALLDISCLACGALLAVGDTPAERVTCARCGAENLFVERRGPGGVARLSAALAVAPAES
jgi:ribosomal protein S27E